jgi:hypothetical protein
VTPVLQGIQGRYKIWQQLNISRMVSWKSLRFGMELRAFKLYYIILYYILLYYIILYYIILYYIILYYIILY